MEYSSIFVCLMGMGTVFFGLICPVSYTHLRAHETVLDLPGTGPGCAPDRR